MRRQRTLIPGMAAAALAASMMAVGQMLPQSAPRLPKPRSLYEEPFGRNQRRVARKEQKRRDEISEGNARNRKANLASRLFKRRQDPKREEKERRQAIVNSMTNWQRTQWARAGYPQKLDEVSPFLALQRAS